MKLTQSQRADVLAQFIAARATASRLTEGVMCDAKEMLEAYEAELATWREPTPAMYGPNPIEWTTGPTADQS